MGDPFLCGCGRATWGATETLCARCARREEELRNPRTVREPTTPGIPVWCLADLEAQARDDPDAMWDALAEDVVDRGDR